MGGISSGVGIFSGIDSRQLIEQLLALAGRPKVAAQRRIAQLQTQQAGYLDVNSRVQALQQAAAAFRTAKVFDTKSVSTSNAEVLSAVATTGAAEGAYTFVVDRLVSTQQFLSRGFADANASSLGAEAFTFEGAEGRLDRDMALADLNGGAGVTRGKISIRDSTGASATVDLSRAATVNEVLEAINSASGVSVTARVSGGRFVVQDTAGGMGTLAITDVAASGTTASLGLDNAPSSGVITGDLVYAMASSTSLGSLNDGNGVFIGNQTGNAAFDFQIVIAGDTENAAKVNIGTLYDAQSKVVAGPASTIGGVVKRINDALSAKGYTQVTASISTDGARLVLTDTMGRTIQVVDNASTIGNTAADLGLERPTATGTLNGGRILADLNSTLAGNLNGGRGLGDGVLDVTLRNGAAFSLTLNPDASVQGIIEQIQAASGTMPGGGPRLSVSINPRGSGLLLTDNTGGSGNLVITGNGSAENAAVALGIDTGDEGVASDTIDSGSSQHRYVTMSTLVSSLNQGRGIGTGVIRITDSFGVAEEVDIGRDSLTIADVIREINSRSNAVKARVNDRGDGILLYEPTSGGAMKIKVEDVSGSVGRALNLVGEAAGSGESNTLDGSFERRVAFAPGDTLEDAARKINESGVGVTASIVNDGSGSTPWRLSIVSRASGASGRVLVNDGGFGLGLRTMDEGRNARVFYGSSDPATALLLTSPTNTLDTVLTGVSIDLTGVSQDPVTLTVTRDTAAVEARIGEFVAAFNQALSRINFQSRYDSETNVRGPLLGDSTLQTLRNALLSTVLGEAQNVSGSFTRLTDVGIRITDGQLSLDTERLREALARDAEGVKSLFTAREAATNRQIQVSPGITVRDPNAREQFSSLGVAGQIEELARRYVSNADGLLAARRRGIDAQILAQRSRITSVDELLASRRTVLERQFLAMEQAIAQLQSQQNSLSSIARVR